MWPRSLGQRMRVKYILTGPISFVPPQSQNSTRNIRKQNAATSLGGVIQSSSCWCDWVLSVGPLNNQQERFPLRSPWRLTVRLLVSRVARLTAYWLDRKQSSLRASCITFVICSRTWIIIREVTPNSAGQLDKQICLTRIKLETTRNLWELILFRTIVSSFSGNSKFFSQFGNFFM